MVLWSLLVHLFLLFCIFLDNPVLVITLNPIYKKLIRKSAFNNILYFRFHLFRLPGQSNRYLYTYCPRTLAYLWEFFGPFGLWHLQSASCPFPAEGEHVCSGLRDSPWSLMKKIPYGSLIILYSEKVKTKQQQKTGKHAL